MRLDLGEVFDLGYQSALLGLLKALGTATFIAAPSSGREWGPKALWVTSDTCVAIWTFSNPGARPEGQFEISFTRRDAANPFR